jgi:alpha-L-fucosidase
MADQATYQEQVEANLRWNFGANLWDIAFITFGLSLVSRTTIMPLLVSELTPSKIAVGLVTTIYSLGFLLPQLLTASYAERLRVNKPFVMLLGGLGERVPYLLMGLVILWLGASAPLLALVLFYLLLATTAASNGVATPAWFSMVAKVIPVHWRGLWSGLARSIGAVLGIAGAAFSTRLITNWPFPQNYGYSFLVAFAFVAISWLGLASNREPESPTVKPHTPFRAYLRWLPQVLRRDRNYRNYVLSQSVASLGAMAAGFFMVYGKDNIEGALAHVGTLTAILVGTQAVMGLVWGLLADRRGHKVVLCGAAFAMAIAASVGLMASSLPWLWVTFVCLGTAMSADAVSRMNIILEFCAPEDRPTYIGLTNAMLAPAMALAPFIGGLLATWAGYREMFLVALVVSVVGGLMLTFWVREPRRGASAAVAMRVPPAHRSEGDQMTKADPAPESVRGHVVPDWFHDAKLGIFIHWGLYSVPAWAPLTGELGEVIARGDWANWFTNNAYAEWYMNTMRIEDSPTRRYHAETYGPDTPYRDFIPAFNEATRDWDPGAWADLFRQIGARYVVLTTKHHDGFLLWPSEHPNPYEEDYCAQRDLVGDLTGAVRGRGMRMGLYYSGGIDWTFNDTVIQHVTDFQAAVPQGADYVAYANAHWRELIARYQPSVMWNDIAYPAAADLDELFAHYYHAIPEGVINDRFTQRFEWSEGTIVARQHRDFRTPEYAVFDEITEEKWEATRGIGYSFGYNRSEGPESYLSVDELVRSFVDIVSKNGNLLLNVGPMADGTIPELQRERLLGLGRWLETNGEAIYSTRPWRVAAGTTEDGVGVRFTQAGENLYAVLLDTPGGDRVVIKGLQAAEGTSICLLDDERPLDWVQEDDDLAISLSGNLPDSPAYALRITPCPQPPELSAGSAARLSTSSTLRDILNDVGGKAVLEKHLGEMLDAPQLDMAMGVSLKQIAGYVPNMLTPEQLDAINSELEKL